MTDPTLRADIQAFLATQEGIESSLPVNLLRRAAEVMAAEAAAEMPGGYDPGEHYIAGVLRHALQTAIDDDYSQPDTPMRSRHIARLNALKLGATTIDTIFREGIILRASLTAANARCERLRKALEPLAQVAKDNDEYSIKTGFGPANASALVNVHIGHLRAARDAAAETGSEKP